MSTYTITEALQDIKTIQKRLEVKRKSIGEYLARDARIKDPLEKQGGSVEFIKREMQALGDLENRVINIRTAIQSSNLTNTLTIGGDTKKVADWLTWRREIATGHKEFLTRIANGIRKVRDDIQRQGGRTIPPTGEATAQPGEIVVNFDEAELVSRLEQIETVLGELDGKLSLANATTLITVQ